MNPAKDHPNQDGIVRGWLDGRLVIDRTDVVRRTAAWAGNDAERPRADVLSRAWD